MHDSTVNCAGKSEVSH